MKKQAEILGILHKIESMQYSDVQSIDLLLEYGFQLTSWIAFTAEAMAEAKEHLHKTRADLYRAVNDEMSKRTKAPAPSLVKDWINDKCHKENGYYELCERTNRAATHSMELVRTAVSALKAELQNRSY